MGGLGWHPIKGLYLSGQALTASTTGGLSHAHAHYIIKRKRSPNDKEGKHSPEHSTESEASVGSADLG